MNLSSINNTREQDEYITADILSHISSMSYNDILLRLHDIPESELCVLVDFCADLTAIELDIAATTKEQIKSSRH